MHIKLWDEITDQLTNVKDATVEVNEWIDNLNVHWR